MANELPADTPWSNRPRLLVLTSTYPRWRDDTVPGFVHGLCQRLVRRGFAVDVLAPSSPGASASEELDGVRVLRYRYFLRRFETLAYGEGILPGLRRAPLRLLLVPFLVAGLLLACRRQLRNGKYTAIHAHWIIPQATCAVIAAGGRVPVVGTAHGSDLAGVRSGLINKLVGWTLARCRRVTVVSEDLRAVAGRLSNLADDEIDILPMGVDLTGQFSPQGSADRAPARLLFVGRLNQEKGIHVLADSFSTLAGKHPDLALEMIGDGAGSAELRRRFGDAGLLSRVGFRGRLAAEEVADAMRRATVAVIPSLREGFGLVAVEAMGCGCPVVASALPALQRTIDDGETGLLVPPSDSRALAAAIDRLLQDAHLRDELARRARLSVVERFDWPIAADAYAQLFRTLVD